MCGVFLFKQKTAYEVRMSDWSSDVCSSDLQIGIAGQAACKTEGQYGERRLRHLAQAEAAADFLLQGVARQACRVDHMFGPATERLQQLAFAGDSVGGWTILRKGVAAARFGIAPLQLRARAVRSEQRRVGKGCVRTGRF